MNDLERLYQASHLRRTYYQASPADQNRALSALARRADSEAERLRRYLALPDLTRRASSPVKAITERIIGLPVLQRFDVIETPEIVPSNLVFDLFNFPADHPARSSSDTYHLDAQHILRPHTSLMWKYYVDIPHVQQQLALAGSAGVLCFGKVYRRDEIDWQHSNVLHQLDGLFICRKTLATFDKSDLEGFLWAIARSLFGQAAEGRFNVEHYPYTDPSLEMEIMWDARWVEILGAGIVHPDVLRNLGFDPSEFNAWAFGFGVDRLAMIKMKIPDIRLLRSNDERVVRQLEDLNRTFQPVSKYPAVVRDISFVVARSVFDPNLYYESVREVIGSDDIEEVKLLDTYSDEARFGPGTQSYTFRITYRRFDRTMTNEEANELHERLRRSTTEDFSASLR